MEGPLVQATCPTRSGKAGRPPSFMRSSALTGYQATRHTFASQWVLAGGSIEKLKEIMGHISVIVTEQYAHLHPLRSGYAH